MPDSTPAHVRALSLIFALLVVIGGWLALEHTNTPLTPLERAPEALEGDNSIHAPRTSPPPKESPYRPVTPSGDVSVTYKCLTNGRVSFGDQPCPANSKVLSVTTAEKSQPVESDRLVRMKRLAAQMEADRLAREQTQQAGVAVVPTTEPQSSKSMHCKSIDDQISLVDARLRQPHDGQTGDLLTGERRKLTDKRFNLGC